MMIDRFLVVPGPFCRALPQVLDQPVDYKTRPSFPFGADLLEVAFAQSGNLSKRLLDFLQAIGRYPVPP